MPGPSYAVVDAPRELADAVRALAGAPRIALDTESNSRHRYPERVCLVQLAGAGRVYLIDPLRVPHHPPQRPQLAKPPRAENLQGGPNA
ncbi:MAG: hypothetical protein OXI25_06560, partial [Chloroflexota bacterium]|nr:hypothetical protein [Chloroflexota bacterium]